MGTMAIHRTDEDNLVTFLGGFNQVFLIYLLLTMVVSLAAEGSKGGLGTAMPEGIILMPEDYVFDLETALAKSTGHSTMVAYMALLFVAATVYVTVARLMDR